MTLLRLWLLGFNGYLQHTRPPHEEEERDLWEVIGLSLWALAPVLAGPMVPHPLLVLLYGLESCGADVSW